MLKEETFQEADSCYGSWNKPIARKKRKEECILSRTAFPHESYSIPWIRWSAYASRDSNNPDKLQIKVVETKPFAAKFGLAVRVLLLVNSEWLP